MTKTRSTKKALLLSVLALVMCASMLVGSTYAWFTDSVASNGNKIIAGNLDVRLLMDAGDGNGYQDIGESEAPIFGGENALIAKNDNLNTLWEPNKTQVAYLAIKNNGSLALKYKVALDVINVDNSDLYKVMQYAIIGDATYGSVTSWNGGTQVYEGVQPASGVVSLGVGETHYFALAIHMDENAGNEYQGGRVDFDISVLATQDNVEADSFGTDYDLLAAFPYAAAGKIEDGASAVELAIKDKTNTVQGSAVIPADAIAPEANGIVEINVTESSYEPNITVDLGAEKVVFDVSVTGLKENNTTPVKLTLRIEAGLDPATVKLYHYDELIDSVYNPSTGIITFESATFSPFTVVYDAESEYVPPVADESKLPTANVTDSDKYENTVLPWGSYGQWSPTAGLEANLEAAYTFSCDETLAEAKLNPYANWYCDFYVMLDKDLGENEIFLGGNYGSFGWVGFHNGDFTLPANNAIPLLGSVTANNWTYLDVVQNVGTFICGVGDVDDALTGATFTVMLRLTNPDDSSDFVNVKTISYTFE